MMREKQSTSRSGQPPISSFFSQRSATKRRASSTSNSPIDLTLDDSDVEQQPPIKKLKSKHPQAPASQWYFEGSSREDHAGTSHVRQDKTCPRAELERILLRSDGQQRQGENSSVDESNSQDGNDSDPVFSELRAMFSLKTIKGNRTSRAKLTARKTKAVTEVGPSGETYTPYEVQVDCVVCSQFSYSHHERRFWHSSKTILERS